MDTGTLIGVASTVASIVVAIFLATIVLIWQMRSQSNKFEQSLSELRAEVRAQGSRISESEREQARLEGVNSVLQQQTHTHEPHEADD